MPHTQLPRETGSSGFLLRAATPADLPAVAPLWETAWLDGHRDRVPDELMALRDSDHFAHYAARWVSVTTVATENAGNLIGLVIVGPDDGEVVQLAVERDARGRGVGTALLQAAETRLSSAHREAWLAVVPGNTKARRFYELHGWHDTGRIVHHAPTRTGTVAVPVHRYVKPLSISYS